MEKANGIISKISLWISDKDFYVKASKTESDYEIQMTNIVHVNHSSHESFGFFRKDLLGMIVAFENRRKWLKEDIGLPFQKNLTM